MLEPLLKFLLPIRWKAAKITVVLECLPLLFQRLIAVLIQPLSRMMAFRGRLIGTGPRIPWWLGLRSRLILRA
jgi:hypothetical protein